MRCKNDCENIVTIKTQPGAKHKANFGCKKNDGVNIKCIGGGSNREERYRIPAKLIKELLKPIIAQIE
jgi:hypothetical protein